MAEIKYIIFGLGEQNYSMKLSRINGIEQIYNIIPVPKTDQCIQGIIHLRNEIVPVYDLKYRFGIEEEREDANKQLLVIQNKDIRLGIEVDEVIGIIAVPEENIKESPQVVRNGDTGYLENVIKVHFAETDTDEIMLSIDVDNLVSESELMSLHQAMEQTEEE